MVKERFNYTFLSANINTVFPVFMLDCLQMYCNTQKGCLDPWAQLCARAEHFGKHSGCSIQSNGDCSVDEGKSYDDDMEGMGFEWEELWSKTRDEHLGRNMYKYSEREGNTAWAARMSKQDNYQEFTKVLLQSWDGLCLSRERVVEEPEISDLQVKSCNGRDFTGVWIVMEKGERRKNI